MSWADRLGEWWVKDDVEEGKRLDDELAALNRRALERGQWTPGQYESAEARRQENSADTYGGQVAESFNDGWTEGADNVSAVVSDTTAAILNTAGSVATAPVRGLLRGLPWWAWLVGGVALLAWSGMLPGVVAAVRSSLKK